MKGINIFNPVDIERDYYLKIVEYAKENGIDHIQINGPIHNLQKGNIGGMITYKKYSQFNGEQDLDYVKLNLKVVNECLNISHGYGIKTYVWHHELDLPDGLKDEFPEIVNEYGDIEVSHPIIKDFLENRIKDFFDTYPKMDGVVLTLHETKVPLLKLKNQKLGKVERVKFVTQTLYDACKKYGKELIVRPFASIAEDYEMMTKAYEEISKDLVIMDKWTQFDWSLCLPHNKFFSKIKSNPLLVETDIFGEYFGKGNLPIFLYNHIIDKYNYCQKFNPVGYCSRIDRAGAHNFGTVNEVNYNIMQALMCGKNVDAEVDEFFNKKYGENGQDVKKLMQETEQLQKAIFYINGYYFTELSRFPSLNHSKNHFYFEIMKDNYQIKSNEWFIPIGWDRGSVENLLLEKQTAVEKSEKLFSKIKELRTKLSKEDYADLYIKFANLYYVAKIWQELLNVYIYYVKALENGVAFENQLTASLERLKNINDEGKALLEDKFYPLIADNLTGGTTKQDKIETFIEEVKASYRAEKKARDNTDKNLTDYIICGGALESHSLKKEVNFSDTLIYENELCRIPGNIKGLKWSGINAHGWFSYEIKVKPNSENEIKVLCGSTNGKLDAKITIDGVETEIHEEIAGKKSLTFNYLEQTGKEKVEIRIDKISASVPLVFLIRVVPCFIDDSVLI